MSNRYDVTVKFEVWADSKEEAKGTVGELLKRIFARGSDNLALKHLSILEPRIMKAILKGKVPIVDDWTDI